MNEKTKFSETIRGIDRTKLTDILQEELPPSLESVTSSKSNGKTIPFQAWTSP
jgi:hypothetical protein